MNPEAARPTDAELRRLAQQRGLFFTAAEIDRLAGVFRDAQWVLEEAVRAGGDTSDAWVDVLAAHDAYKAAIRARVLA